MIDNNLFAVDIFETLNIFTDGININVDIIVKDFNNNNLYFFYNMNLENNLMWWIHCESIHTYNEFFLEMFQNGEIIYRKLFFRDPEKSFIDKKELTIVIQNEKIIEEFVEYYSKFGKVLINEDLSTIDTKYILVLKKYLLDVPKFLNEIFFNRNKIIESENKSAIGWKSDVSDVEEVSLLSGIRFLEDNIIKIKYEI